MLETITDPTKTNIHYLNLEEPQRPSEFPGDVRKWIRPEQAKIIKSPNSRIPLALWNNIDTSKRAALILFPEDCPVDKLTKIAIKENLLELHNVQSSQGAVFLMLYKQAANAKFLFPDEELINDSEWDMIKKYLYSTERYPALSYFECAASIKILSSEKAREFDLDYDGIWQLGLQALEDFRRGADWFTFISLAAHMKTVNPERFKEFEIKDEDWKGMKKYLENGPPSDYLAEKAVDILTLQADEIKLTPTGVEVIMPEPKVALVEEIPALPETRKF